MPPIAEQRFAKTFESLPAVFSFLEETLARLTGNPDHLQAFSIGVEEFFTNMVKYHPEGPGPVTIRVDHTPSEVRVMLSEHGVEPYDVTRAPEPDLHAPVEERRVGGLGIHLSRALLDGIEYGHADGTSTVTLRKQLEPSDVLNRNEREG